MMRPIGILVLAIGACAPSPPSVDSETERAALRRADSLYSAAATSKDVSAVTALHAADATVYPPSAPVVTGIEGVRTFATEFTAVPGMTTSFEPHVVEVASSGDMGYTINMVDVSFTGPDGNPVRERIRDFHLWRKQVDGSWKIVVDIWNAGPMASPPVPSGPVR